MMNSDRRRLGALTVLSFAQLVVLLDGTIVSIALPQTQEQLGMTEYQRQWVVTAYTLSFGALLLLGGRVADYWGRKRAFITGMLVFAASSAFGGFAVDPNQLIAARALQGASAALLAPAALALVSSIFPKGQDRIRAFAIFGAVGGMGFAVGLIAGGVLTQIGSWRWCLFVNVPLAVCIGGVAAYVLHENRSDGDHHYDLPGALTATVGLGFIVYALTRIEDEGPSKVVAGLLTAGFMFLVVFLCIQRTSKRPLLPLRLITDRIRCTALSIQALTGCVTIGTMLYVTLYLQTVTGLSPLETGLATLPMPLGTFIAVPVVTRLLTRTGPRTSLIVGPATAGVALVYLAVSISHYNYALSFLPALLVLGFGLGFMFVSLQNLLMAGIQPQDSGAAAALADATLQIGGSVGLALLSVAYGMRDLSTQSNYAYVFAVTAALLFGSAIAAFASLRNATRSLHTPLDQRSRR